MSEECASGRGKGVTWIRLGDDRAETGASAKRLAEEGSSKRDNRLAAEEGYRRMGSEATTAELTAETEVDGGVIGLAGVAGKEE